MTEEAPVIEEEPGFQLGDRIYITATGPLDGLRGRIYYLDENLIRILPDGTFHRLEDIPVVDGDFDPVQGITAAYVLKKRVSDAFVVQHDFQVGHLAETIKENGEMGVTYRIKTIDEENDTVILEDSSGAEKTVVFGFKGVPQDEEFIIMRVREPPDAVPEENAEPVQAPQVTEEEAAGLEILDTLEVPDIVEIREIQATQRFYPDIVQRNDMLQDLLSALTIKQQKNPQKQSDIRRLVEQMILLRNQVALYSRSGEPIGKINTFYGTLSELLDSGKVPLSRPVANAKRVVYLDHSIEHVAGKETDPVTSVSPSITVEYLSDVVTATNEYYKTQLGGVSGQPIVGNALPNWFLSWDGYLSRFLQSWQPAGQTVKPLAADTEFFRGSVPNFDEKKSIDGLDLDQLGGDKTTIVGVDWIMKVRMSLLRGAGPRMGRLREKETPRIVESGENLSIDSYLLFPMKYDRDIGAIRSGKLALDMGKGLMTPMWMEWILYKQPVSEVPSAGAIFNVSGASLGNISIEDWLQGQPLESRGMGDVLNKLASFGLAEKELSLDQMNMVVEKLDAYRALVKTSIVEINAKSKAEVDAITLQNNPLLLPEVVKQRVDQLLAEPTFQKAILEFQAKYPSYRENDIAMFAYLFVNMYDFTFAVLSGAPATLQMEIRRKARGDFLRRLYESARLLEKNEKKVGFLVEKPTIPRSNVREYVDVDVRSPNPCPHVTSLTMVRKIKDESLRMKSLLEFLTRFGGEKKDNWIHCKVCSKGAICVHERLLLQEYLKPLEKDALHKELLLTFSRDQFHGRFCCGNCGQSISEIDYDISLEYDDEGRPMSGRAVLVDKDSVLQDQIDQALGVPISKVEDIAFTTETQTDAYKAAKTIAGRVGVVITTEGYRKIAQRVEVDLSKQGSREDYAKFQKAQKAKGVGTIDYDVLRSKLLVTSVAAYLLVEIQTGIPSYTTRYRLPGCSKPGFTGFPSAEKENTTGIDYLACAIAGITESVPPWSLTGFLREKSIPKRQTEIAKMLMATCGNALKNSDVQQDMALRREYVEKKKEKLAEASDEALTESVPAGFAPEQRTGSLEGPVIVADAAGPRERGRGWILLAHEIAKQTTALGSGSPYSEAACCYHPLQTPTSFWDEKNAGLPTFSQNKPLAGPKGSHLTVHYNTRKQERMNVVAPDSILYRVFLQVCFDGPRKGLPHEPGYDFLCPHCGFQFPRSSDILTPEEGRVALESQQIDTSRKRFQELLDESHERYSVEPVKIVAPLTGLNLLEKLRDLVPQPFAGWSEAVSNTILAVQTFSADKAPEETDVATAYGPLSNMAEGFKQLLIERLGTETGRTLERLVSQPPADLVQSLQSYFLVPFQRLKTKFNISSLRVQKSYKLGDVADEDIEGLLNAHLSYLDEARKRYVGLARAKIEAARKKLLVCLPLIQKEIRTPLVPGGSIGLPYLLQAMVLGIMAECADPNLVPAGERIDAGPTEPRGAMQILSICLGRFRAEGLNFTGEEIRNMIARRDEVEKMRIIGKLDRMSPEEKAAELINKRLGLGDWAIGGSKAIREHNEQQYERERRERGEMVGLVEGAPAADETEGYDNAQTGDDDY
jgi:hypothetical protein